MNIGILTGNYPTLSEQFIINHVEALARTGVDLTVVGARRPPEENTGPFEILGARVPRGTIPRVFVTLLRYCATLFTRPGVVLKSLQVRKYRTAVSSGKAIGFWRKLRRRRFDVLHCHFGPNGLTGAFLKDIGIADRLVVAFHGSDAHVYPRQRGEDVYRYMFQCADAVTVNTNFTRDKVVSLGCPPAKIEIVPEVLRIADFNQRRYAPRPDRFVVLTVGRLVEKKGHVVALKAIAIAAGQVPEIQYRIVGRGKLLAELQEEAVELGIVHRVSFVGALPPPQVRQEYAACDVFVLASRTAASGDMEGQGLVLQEAQAMGVPVISTLHNGIPDGVLDGESGLLVPESDAEKLAEAIVWMADNRDRLDAMGEAGRKFVEVRYDADIVAGRVVEMYARIGKG